MTTNPSADIDWEASPEGDAFIEAVASALDYLYYRDRMNAEIHRASVRYSPLTVDLAKGLAWAGVEYDLVTHILESPPPPPP